MSLVLGIDTSGTVGSVAVLGPALEIEEVFEEGLIHGVALGPTVERVLARADAGVPDLTLIAVGRGPGSYTGVRVGVAFAKTLAFASDRPVVGVSSFAAMARRAPRGRRVLCVRDARRGNLYYQAFDGNGVEEEALALLPVEGLPGSLPPDGVVIGDAAQGFSDLLSGDGREIGDERLWHASSLEVARLGLEDHAERGPDDPHDLSPVYLRLSEAEEKLGRKGEE